MPDQVPDFRLFRYALLAAEHGSFRRAASILNVQQSSVSKGVRSLEYRIGAALFERNHAGVRPTSAGERFLREAMLGFDHFERAMHRIGAIQRGERGDVTIAASVPFLLLGDVLEPFREVHPAVSLEMMEDTCNGSLALVQQRRVDIAFVSKPAVGETTKSLRLREEPMIAVLPKSHRLAKARAVTLEELRSEKLILSANGLGPELGDHLIRRMATSGALLDIQLQKVGQCDLVNMVVRGFGVTITVGKLTRSPPDDIVLIPLAGRNVVTIHAAWMQSNPNPALSGLVRLAQRIAV